MERMHLNFRITDDRSEIDRDTVYRLLKDTYWASERSMDEMNSVIDNSICISVFDGAAQVAFGRVLTDKAVFAWIGDLIVDPEYRSRGIGKAIMSFIQDHPEVPDSGQTLGTKDAHGLYEKFGFKRVEYMRK